MKTIPLVFLIGAALISGGAARSAPTKAVVTAPDCFDKSGTTGELTQCAASAVQVADQRLNRSYEAVMCHLEPDDREKLKSAERAWIAFRDSDCAFFAGDGSIASMNFLLCKASLSEARAKELDSWPPNAPRDAIGPCPSR